MRIWGAPEMSGAAGSGPLKTGFGAGELRAGYN